LHPIGHSIAFTSTDYNSFSWAAGSIRFKYGSALSINAGSATSLSANDVYWVYATLGSATLQVTNSVTNATGSNKIIVALVRTTFGAATSQSVTIVTRWGNSAEFAGSHVICDSLDAIEVDCGELTAGTITGVLIRTAASGARIEMDSSTFEAIDSGNEARVVIPSSGAEIRFYDDGGTYHGKIEGDSVNGALHIDANSNFYAEAPGALFYISEFLGAAQGVLLAEDGSNDDYGIVADGYNGYTRIYAAGGVEIQVEDEALGFYGVSTTTRQTVSGARDNPEEALANLISAMATLGLIIDGTSAS
jgi:hypothetical protein